MVELLLCKLFVHFVIVWPSIRVGVDNIGILLDMNCLLGHGATDNGFEIR